MNRTGAIIIANALIWGTVLVATALALKGSGYSERVLSIIGGGAAATLLISGNEERKSREKKGPKDDSR